MATITGLTADRMLEIEAASVVDGDVVGNDLILAKKDGSIINAGNVRGPAGPAGPMGSSLAVVTAQQLFDVGQAGQLRAGRQLSPADFTNMGLNVPIGLWNLSNANDSSGNGRHLSIKGAVPFGSGINGLASTAAVFSGSAAQAFYIVDGGASDPFRIRVGSWGCWFKTAKRATNQWLFAKSGASNAVSGISTFVNTNNSLSTGGYDGTSGYFCAGVTDIADDRWHFVVTTYDGTRIRLYIDGAFESHLAFVSLLNPNASSPFNLGGSGADGSASSTSSHFGRMDEAFITGDVLTEEQQRNLYCASISHSLGSVPMDVKLGVQRKRRGGLLAVSDFPSQPLRLYNFSGGSLADQGSNNTPLTLTNTPQQTPIAGVDGLPQGAYHLNSLSHNGLASSDAGLPAGLATRSYGVWFKSGGIGTAANGLLSWGAGATSAAGVWLGTATASGRVLYLQSAAAGSDITGPDVIDSTWHHIVVVEDNGATDGLKRKLYVDGKMVGSSTTMASIALGGANRFRVGASADGTSPIIGQVDGVFVHSIALTAEQVRKLYDVGSQILATSLKSPEEHIEANEAGRLLAVFDTLETCDSINLAVAA